MIRGIGLDVVEIARIRSFGESSDAFLHRVYSTSELGLLERSDPYPHLAARFAAKEAVFKALGTGWSDGLKWTDVQVVTLPSGQPSIHLEGRARTLAAKLGVNRIYLSLTHTETYAAAQVVMEGDEPTEADLLQ